jgi:hypothetical protein
MVADIIPHATRASDMQKAGDAGSGEYAKWKWSRRRRICKVGRDFSGVGLQNGGAVFRRRICKVGRVSERDTWRWEGAWLWGCWSAGLSGWRAVGYATRAGLPVGLGEPRRGYEPLRTVLDMPCRASAVRDWSGSGDGSLVVRW